MKLASAVLQTPKHHFKNSFIFVFNNIRPIEMTNSRRSIIFFTRQKQWRNLQTQQHQTPPPFLRGRFPWTAHFFLHLFRTSEYKLHRLSQTRCPSCHLNNSVIKENSKHWSGLILSSLDSYGKKRFKGVLVLYVASLMPVPHCC